MRKRDIKERFQEKFRVTPGCWLWNAALGSSGYGHFWGGVRPTPAHRTSYQLFNGDIANGLSVLHRCDNRRCVNPDHLFLGTVQDNTADMVQKNRQAKGSRLAMAKLSEEDIAAIRCDQRSQRKIALEYGVSHTSIWEVKNNLSWRHAK